ncbi:uncharacterized protein [Littorina saxatilis]|uniref:uncharacterized protein n=1 Tax=Littorina saxatilis TaxID=31220 RepID=UPI0038B59B5A
MFTPFQCKLRYRINIIYSVSVNLQIVATTHCPDTFVEGGPNLVNCTIYGDRVTCSPTPTKIPIILTEDGNPGVSANPDYPPTCNPDVGVIPNGEAKCTKKDGNTYTYVYKFMGANKTHKRDTLQCTVPCFGVTPDIGNACEITFEEPTEVGSGTTDTNCNNRGTNSTSSDGKGSSSSNLGLIIGATAGGVVVVAMAIGISIYCYKKRSSGGHNASSDRGTS